MDEVETIKDAPWKLRYQARQIFWARIAEENPTHGLVATDDADGVIQLHAWETGTGDLRVLTHDPHGVTIGMLSPDGRHVYLLDDPDGDEVGHLVRIPFTGGSPHDLTPDLPTLLARAAACCREQERPATRPHDRRRGGFRAVGHRPAGQ